MTRFIIVRHGHSLSNKGGTLTGQIDSPLSETGIEQAKLICKFLKENYKIDAIYSSDLSRAVDTVKHLGKDLGLQVITDKRFREIDCGIWQGKTFDVLMQDKEYRFWNENMGTAQAIGGESFLDVQKRALNAIEDIYLKRKEQTVVIASHGGLIRTLQCHVAKEKIENLSSIPWVPNASTSVIIKDGNNYQYELNGFCDYLGNLITKLSSTLK